MKYLTGVLSSKTITYFYKKYCGGVILGKKGYQYNKHAVEKIYIPQISPEAQKSFIDLVDKILKITSAEDYDPKKPPIEQKELEKQIDKMVYELYGLTEEEIKIVEDSSKK